MMSEAATYYLLFLPVCRQWVTNCQTSTGTGEQTAPGLQVLFVQQLHML